MTDKAPLVGPGTVEERSMGGPRTFDGWWQREGCKYLPQSDEPPQHAYVAEKAWNAALAATEETPLPGQTSGVGNGMAIASESGWLIERRMQLPPEYLYVPDWSGFKWTQDSLKALRFSRREDAEQVAHIFENGDVYITEHQWG